MLTSSRIPASTANVPERRVQAATATDRCVRRDRAPPACDRSTLAATPPRRAASSPLDRVGAATRRPRRPRRSRRARPIAGAPPGATCCRDDARRWCPRRDEDVVRTRSRRRPRSPRRPASAGRGRTRSRSADAVGERVDRVARAAPAACARGRVPITASPAPGVGPGDTGRVRVAAERAGRGEVGLEELGLGRGAHRRGRRRGRRGRRRSSASVPSTFGSRARVASRECSVAAAASPLADTISSTGPSCSYASAADRRVERVADHERAGHDRGPEQRTEDDERGLARPTTRVAQREPPEHGLAREHERGTAATGARR